MTNLVLAFSAGVLVVLSMSLNSALGQRIGVFRAASVNYLVGLAGALAVALAAGWQGPGATPEWWAWTGGLLGVAVVIGSNVAVPRLSAAVATVLIVAGQTAAGLILVALATGAVSVATVAGATLIAVGALVTRLGSHPPRQPSD